MKRETPYLFTSLIFRQSSHMNVIQRLSEEFGKAIVSSETIPFNFTNYYDDEMGEKLLRKWVLFDCKIEPDTIADIKNNTIRIEQDLAQEGKRSVNIDPGYITPSKVILATTKDNAHRIYLRDGIFAEITLMYVAGAWKPQQRTYRDYRTKTAVEFFEQCRTFILKRNKL